MNKQEEQLKEDLEVLKSIENNIGQKLSSVKEIENKIAKINENPVSKYKEFLKGFDEEFETHTKNRIKETPLLLTLFRDFIQEIYRPSEIYKLSIQAKKQITEELNKNLNKQQKKLLEKWQYYENIMSEDLVEQAFIYGYSMCNQLKEESIKQYNYRNSKITKNK